MATEYTAKTLTAPPNKDTLTVVTWNIRFGIGRAEWFGDSCGELVLFDTDEIQDGLELLAAKITAMGADILLLQEVDTDSKRSAYVDQVQWLLDNTEFNYGVYASMWEVQFVPSDGLGRVNTGNAILSHWPLSEAERIQLSLRGDQDALTRAFYVRRNVLRAKVNYPGSPFWAVDIHASAFSNDDTKQKQYLEFKAVLEMSSMPRGKILLPVVISMNYLPVPQKIIIVITTAVQVNQQKMMKVAISAMRPPGSALCLIAIYRAYPL